MSFGKMTAFIDIVETKRGKDAEAFGVDVDTVLARVRAYREDRHGTEKWVNLAAFSEATALFKFRTIPGLTVTTSHIIICGIERFRILSVLDAGGRGMYIEALASRIEGSVR